MAPISSKLVRKPRKISKVLSTVNGALPSTATPTGSSTSTPTSPTASFSSTVTRLQRSVSFKVNIPIDEMQISYDYRLVEILQSTIKLFIID